MKKIIRALRAVNNSDMSADIKIDVINELLDVLENKAQEKAEYKKVDVDLFVSTQGNEYYAQTDRQIKKANR